MGILNFGTENEARWRIICIRYVLFGLLKGNRGYMGYNHTFDTNVWTRKLANVTETELIRWDQMMISIETSRGTFN
jgi:hypothetical protein